MRKLIRIAVVGLIVLLIGGIYFATGTTADAAKWHKGVPKVVRNRTYMISHVTDKNLMAYVGYTFTNKSLFAGHTMDGGHFVKHLKYKKVGKKTYSIKGSVSGDKERLKLKVINKNKLTVKDLDNGGFKGYASYKYSGKIWPKVH